MNEQMFKIAQQRVEKLHHEARQQSALKTIGRPLRLHVAAALHGLADHLEGRRPSRSHAQLRA